jgi:hypothetical protein
VRLVIALERIAALDVAAASGLVLAGDELVVIADDELALSRYGRDGQPRGRTPLFDGSLPDEPRARKRSKPDLEALAALPDGRLFALGSGSAPARDRGALVRGGEGAREVDLAPLYGALRGRVDRVNVEGACVLGDELILLTRRTGRSGRNAMVRLDLGRALAALDRAAPRLDPSLVVAVQDVELGSRCGTPLGFTDAAAWRGGLLFAVAAEVTDDPLQDGACVACEIGWLDRDGAVHRREPVEPCVKLEGIAVDGGAEPRLFAVADADDRAVPAPLFVARLPGSFG